MSRRGAQWTGWQTWSQWKGAGVVGEMLDYTDDKVITQQALGRTGSKITACRAMDAAVAYSLASFGPPETEHIVEDEKAYDVVTGGLSANELVNDYTKRAYLIEQRVIGYGAFRDPDLSSCGHDEVYTNQIKFLKIESVKQYQSKDKTVVVVQPKIGSRWSGNYYMGRDDVIGYGLTEYDMKHLSRKIRVDNVDVPALLERYIRARWEIPEGANIEYQTQPFTVQAVNYKGDCKWVGDDAYYEETIEGEVVKKQKTCSHHGNALIKGWALHPNGSADSYMELYQSSSCKENWNKNMLQNLPESIRDSPDWVRWEDVMRSFTQTAPEKEVKKLITKSLNRMLKRNDNVVHKVGLRNNAKFSWSDWGWQEEITQYIKMTTSMNRKIGDNVKGWVYGTIRERTSYDMKISDFVWRPADDIDMNMYYYSIQYYGKVNSWNSYATWQNIMHSSDLEIFFTKEDAQAKGEALLKSMIDNESSVIVRRTSEGLKTGLNYRVTTTGSHQEFIMKGNVAPEDYLSPKEILKLAVNAHPTVIKTHREKFEEFSRPVAVKIIKKEKEVEA